MVGEGPYGETPVTREVRAGCIDEARSILQSLQLLGVNGSVHFSFRLPRANKHPGSGRMDAINRVRIQHKWGDGCYVA